VSAGAAPLGVTAGVARGMGGAAAPAGCVQAPIISQSTVCHGMRMSEEYAKDRHSVAFRLAPHWHCNPLIASVSLTHTSCPAT
jgi:hypothetical protein